MAALDVVPGSGAERAGLQAAQRQYQGQRVVFVGGDIITALDGQPVRMRDEMTLYLENNKRPGNEVRVTVIRSGETQEMVVER